MGVGNENRKAFFNWLIILENNASINIEFFRSGEELKWGYLTG